MPSAVSMSVTPTGTQDKSQGDCSTGQLLHLRGSFDLRRGSWRCATTAAPCVRGMVDYELCKQRDEAQRQARPHLFFDSQRHVAEMKAKLAADPDFDVMHNPSVSSSDVSTSTIAKSCAGSSTFVDLLKRQYGQV
ncbi:unnamed protein product [Durusdinium trenchii]|uniref:Uncharacterized protein n=1 Tax=Durusdinium trenchii TaxID=1381693 RepID=A0ABP0SVW0_9DINO